MSLIGTVYVAMPRFAATACASVILPELEYGDGINTPVTFSAPRTALSFETREACEETHHGEEEASEDHHGAAPGSE